MKKANTLPYPVQKLDDICRQQAKAIGGIKIDVENFEFEVLTGAKKPVVETQTTYLLRTLGQRKTYLTLNYLQNEIGYHVKIYDGQKLVPYTGQNVLNYFLVP